MTIYVALIGLLGTIIGAVIAGIYHWYISKKDRVNQIRMAALDKRLQAHQEAYALWWELMGQVHNTEKISEVALKCQDWWARNCLYLEPGARKEFKQAYILAHDFPSILATDPEKRNWFKIINGVGELLAKGVELPSIGEDEAKKITPNI